jgi:RsiW-degrading membrane proteinase PrsW (M82 family)
LTQTASATPARGWGAVTLGGHQVPVRTFIFWVGVSFWLGNMILHTGSFGVTELWASLYFVIELVVITSATRTVTIDLVAVLYCWGGAMMGVMYLVSLVFTAFVPSPDAVSRQFVVPILEEALKIAPVVFILWRHRASRLWSMGASDILLLGAASGAGFGLVEEAYFHQAVGATRALAWFPLTRINGAYLTVGHGSWTAVAGATLGLALLWRPRRPLLQLLAAGGILCSIFDHSGHNYAVDRTGFSVDLFNFLTAHGWIAFYLFVLAVIVVVASDLYVVRRTLSGSPELKMPPLSGGLKGVNRVWRLFLRKRELGYLLFKSRHVPDRDRAELILQWYALAQSLVWFHNPPNDPPLPSQTDH